MEGAGEAEGGGEGSVARRDGGVGSGRVGRVRVGAG